MGLEATLSLVEANMVHASLASGFGHATQLLRKFQGRQPAVAILEAGSFAMTLVISLAPYLTILGTRSVRRFGTSLILTTMIKTANKKITAVVCTRNRGDSIVSSIQTTLANTHKNFELIIVDQSTTEDTANAVAPFLVDTRVHYLRTSTQGLGRARNIGIQAASSEVIVFTDDDCQVPPDWMRTMQSIFDKYPHVAVAFCNVDPADYDPQKGFIPAYQCKQNTLLTSIRQKPKARGIGAGIAVRRESIINLGGFDEQLGAGGLFPSCEDGDLTVRALLRGYHVYETCDVSVLHFGYRKHSEGRELSRRDWFAIGAAYAKPLKAGHWNFAIVPAYEFFVVALLPLLFDLIRLRRPRGVTRIISFVHGFVNGWQMPLDTRTLLFRS